MIISVVSGKTITARTVVPAISECVSERERQKDATILAL